MGSSRVVRRKHQRLRFSLDSGHMEEDAGPWTSGTSVYFCSVFLIQYYQRYLIFL